MNVKSRLFPPQQKPGLGSEIDWGHPLSRGLALRWLLNECAGLRVMDLAGGSRGQGLISGAAWSPTPRGTALACDGSTSVVTGPDLSFNYDQSMSIVVRHIPTSTAANRVLVSKTNWEFTFICLATKVCLHCWTQPGSDALDVTSAVGAVVAGTLNTHAAVYDGQRHIGKVFGNGRLLASAAPTASPFAKRVEGITLGKGYNWNFNSAPYIGSILDLTLYARALTPDDVRWLYQEPYAMIRPAGPMRRYFTVTGLDQVFRTREQPQRFRLRELPARFAMKELPQRFRMTEKRP
jgi:hypothetical protein